MTDILVDQAALRAQVQQKYRDVALEPNASFHFHTGRSLASRLGYPAAAVDGLPDSAVESFAGVGSPFALRDLEPANEWSTWAAAPGSTPSSLPDRSDPTAE